MRLFWAILLRLPILLIAGTIWFLSSQSTLPQPVSFWGLDKLAHFVAFGTLGIAVGLWITPALWKRHPVLAVLLITLIGSAYGVIDEVHQFFVPYRDCSILDWLADTLGALCSALAVMFVTHFLRKRKKENNK